MTKLRNQVSSLRRLIKEKVARNDVDPNWLSQSQERLAQLRAARSQEVTINMCERILQGRYHQ